MLETTSPLTIVRIMILLAPGQGDPIELRRGNLFGFLDLCNLWAQASTLPLSVPSLCNYYLVSGEVSHNPDSVATLDHDPFRHEIHGVQRTHYRSIQMSASHGWATDSRPIIARRTVKGLAPNMGWFTSWSAITSARVAWEACS